MSEIVDSGRFSGGQRMVRAPEKSNFSQTCNLLSQYLKEKGSFGDLNLGISAGGLASNPSAATMNLFPAVVEKSGQSSVVSAARNLNSINFFPQQSGFAPALAKQEAPMIKTELSANKPKPESAAQMTIFYAGQVIVFNDFPAEKAKEIMLLASKGSPQTRSAFPPAAAVVDHKPAAEPVQKVVNPSPPNFTSSIVQERAQIQKAIPSPAVSDLPIARKASLSRFLEKRKDRITARAPYQTGKSGFGDGAAAPPSKVAESKSWLGLAPQSPLPFEAQQ